MTSRDQKREGGTIPPSRDTAAAAARAASSKQAQDIVILNVSELIVITDHFVICTATSTRQIKSVVDEIERALREHLGVRPARREGEGGAGWWLLDYIDVHDDVAVVEDRRSVPTTTSNVSGAMLPGSSGKSRTRSPRRAEILRRASAPSGRRPHRRSRLRTYGRRPPMGRGTRQTGPL